jgi:RecB family exonuclease
MTEHEGKPSASPFARYERCPGSFQLEQEARRLNQLAHQDSPAARRGTLIHAFLAGELDEDGEPIKLDPSEQQTADFLLERASAECIRIFGDEAAVQQLDEKRLWLTLNGRKVLSGRFDRVLWRRELALVQDFKTGFSEPDPAEQNAQLKVLAVLVALSLPNMPREVVVQIVSGPFGVTEARFDHLALAAAYDSILATLRAIQDPLAPLNPSPPACRYCPAINICQAVKDFILPVAKTQVSALPEGARGAKLLDEVEVISAHLDSIREYYTARLTADPAFDLPGYALVPGNSEREVKDWKTAKLRLGEYIDDARLNEAASYGIGKIEAALAKELKLTQKQAKEKFNQILNGLIEFKQKKASLKRVSGKPKLVTVELP